MSKFAFVFVCLAILGIGIYYVYMHEKMAEGEKEDFLTWKEFVPRSGLFKTLLPSPPQYGKDYIAIPNSDKKRRYDMYAAEKIDGTLFLISVITYPPEVDISSSDDIIRQNIEDLMHNKVDNRLTKLVNLSLHEHKTFDFSIENRDFDIQGRSIQDDHVVYMLVYITQKESFDPKEYQYFIDSFQLLNRQLAQSRSFGSKPTRPMFVFSG